MSCPVLADSRAAIAHARIVFLVQALEEGRHEVAHGLFLMNLMLAAGGYPWTVIPVQRREDSELAVSSQAANEAVRRLQESAVISERSGRGRGRLFAAEEVISVLARPFGSDPDIALEGARRTLGLSG